MQKTVINDEKLKNHKSSNSTIQIFKEYLLWARNCDST